MTGYATKIYEAIVFVVISTSLVVSISSCKSEEVFRDYTKTESYSSSAEIVDTTYLAEIISAKNETKLIDYTPIVTAGQNTSITIKAAALTEYRIEVEYSSGISKSKSLTPKTSDQNGYINWQWQVGVNCKSGKFPVRIYKGTELVFETRLTIE